MLEHNFLVDQEQYIKNPIRFGAGFWHDHAKTLVTDPESAVIEIVANCWDAGADTVSITWPDQFGKVMSIADNGTGMDREEFISRWSELNYNRVYGGQGLYAEMPLDNRTSKRRAYGKNGKGRHSMFCFNFVYNVETWKNDVGNLFEITRKDGESPFSVRIIKEKYLHEGHGTIISGVLSLNYISIKKLRELIGSKFVLDPGFKIYVNNSLIEFTDLSDLTQTEEISIANYGTIRISRLDSKKRGKTSKQHGVAWWVNNRLVGQPSWKGVEGSYLDARSTVAKHLTFIVEADILENEVLYDWTWFQKSPKTDEIVSKVNDRIKQLLNSLFAKTRKEHKKQAIEDNEPSIRELPKTTQRRIGLFVEELQNEVPTMSQEHLSATVSVLAKLEQARTGYKLLEQLALLPSDDYDRLSEILETWTIRDAQVVLEELDRRLKLLRQLQQVIEVRSDELHVLQPIFEKGLWMFGPEYESISYTSNRSLSTVINSLLDGKSELGEESRRRPDFVVLPFTTDRFDDNGEVRGIDKVLIVELKKGNFTITKKEMRQAEDYATHIRNSGRIEKTGKIICYVLGTNLGEDAQQITIGENNQIIIYARAYSTIIQQAHARTFYLQNKIAEDKKLITIDKEIEEILNRPRVVNLF